ncbi:toll/interleukin-1 receptor domain-containing protein [uncultured Pelagimonas sp.]|uniref:toll/interleukin-1 receptor domain-containing protein n=1 Tax=uncultured Pelagimonas sp. TaxID=1618102 RepID=UPI002628ED25|nr:toll/interleukin-1 receptor domain-containing protein [uncultured Pelagimonas sp.]
MTVKLFISHASEDKEDFVRPLAQILSEKFDVWYDEFSLNIGDSLLHSVQNGIRTADYGIIVLSQYFFSKKWPLSEMEGLFNEEVVFGKKIIPVWKDVNHTDVSNNAPIFAGRLAANSADGHVVVANQIERAILTDVDRSVLRPNYEVEIEEINSYNEICDIEGRKLVHKNEFCIKAISDQVHGYTEQYQSDGYIENFSGAPGRIESITKEQSIYYVRNTFDSPLLLGESMRRTAYCEYYDSFMSEDEYWVFRQSNPTRNLTIQIVFPIERPPKNCAGYVRKLNYDEEYHSPPRIVAREDRRRQIEWNIPRVGLESSYILRWKW